MLKRLQNLLSIIGPGLLWAGAAVGVSHLVQSTSAGANYGFSLIWVVLLANLLKYPFFEYGPRYAAATGNTLLIGYKRLGNWAFYLYLTLTFLTMFTIQGVVTIISASLVKYLTASTLSLSTLSLLLMLFSMTILALGKYSLLDKLVKWVIITLAATTVLAVIVASGTMTPYVASSFKPAFPIGSAAGVALLVGLMGWMPSAIDISVWSSIWTTEKHKENPEATTVKNALLDFRIGYFGTVIIALAFLSLGALVMYNSGESFSGLSGGKFAEKLISIYTSTIGDWSKYLVGFAALATMFSTTITCLDAYGRVLSKSESVIRHGHDADEKTYFHWMALTILGTFSLLLVVTSGVSKLTLTQMVMIATALSFLTSPILAALNYYVVTHKDVPKEFQPNTFLRVLSLLGFLFLTGFSIWYLKVTFF